MNKKRVEKDCHRQAFLQYFELQKDDTIKDVFTELSKKTGITQRTLYQWSSDFGWKGRVAEIEEKANREAHNKLVKQISKSKSDSLEFLIKYKKQIEDKLLNEKRDSYWVKDYEMIYKIFALEIGEATERTENKNTNTLTLADGDKETMTNLVKEISRKIDESKEE